MRHVGHRLRGLSLVDLWKNIEDGGRQLWHPGSSLIFSFCSIINRYLGGWAASSLRAGVRSKKVQDIRTMRLPSLLSGRRYVSYASKSAPLRLAVAISLISSSASWATPTVCTNVNYTTSSEEDRRVVAEEIHQQFTRLSEAIPSLSPREQDWIQEEYYDEIAKNGFTRRAGKAMASIEYVRLETKARTQGIANNSYMLSNLIFSDRNLDLWARVVISIIDHNYARDISRLVDEGEIPLDSLPVLANESWTIPYSMNSYGQCILEKVISRIHLTK